GEVACPPMSGASPGGDELRRDLARLVGELLAESAAGDGQPVGPRIRAHLGPGADELPILAEDLEDIDLPNLQLALDALFARLGWGATVVGIGGQAKRFSMLGLSELLMGRHWTVGPPEYTNVPVGPGRTLACLDFALVLVTSPDGPIAIFVRRGEEHAPGGPGLTVQAVAPAPGVAEGVLAAIRDLIVEVDVFRGQVITVEVTPTGRRTVAFLDREAMDPRELVLPDGVLERIERHVLGPSRHRDALVAAGRHLGRGLLLWGPPGTGKTLTVRYLTGRLVDATVVILTGGALGMAGAFGALARRLAPAVVVLEDVDLVAEERVYGPHGGSSPVLFDLMNEMSGQSPDADVAFILTTNRPDALEPALAARPGRVDLAVEIPLPDAECRRRLLDLYARGMDLRLDEPAAVVARMEGVTASFVKELLRKAVLGAAEAGRRTVTQGEVDAALDELLHETSALTRVLLGSGDPSATAAGPSRAWMQSFPRPDGSATS
ncbi:MAG: ATP-binding protein, partial [Actinomycetota bacterium]